MDGPTLINNIDRIDRLHSFIRHDCRDLGIKLPKSKKVKKQNQSRRSIALSSQNSQEGVKGNKIFGQHLSQIPCVFLDQYGYVPQFLITTGEIVTNHSEIEGIFRKSGSIGRTKELRIAVENGKPLEEANIHDVTSLMKQFFRELPEPLVISIYHEAFIKSFQLPPEKDRKDAVLRLCLLLPLENLGALRYTMHLLHRVAQSSCKNRMTYNNLALVMAPNVMGGATSKNGQKMTAAEEKVLNVQTGVVEMLIQHWDQVGMVTEPLRQQLNLMSECFGTDDDMDVSDDNTLEDSKDVSRKKKRRRSGSLTGIVSSIAQGIAKLRRSTDGKSINMSSKSSYCGELSLASDVSTLSHTQDISVSDATPYIMRKRRASGDAGPFTSSKKQAILDNLPQKSLLVSTPFTPSSTLKRDPNPHKDGLHQDRRLNATTPIMGTKPSRKKLNLFTSPGSNKKVKRQTSVSGRLESPPTKPAKGKNIFRRKSGGRDNHRHKELALSSENIVVDGIASPKAAVSDSSLYKLGRTKVSSCGSSSSSLQDGSESSLVVVDDEADSVADNVFFTEEESSESVTQNSSKFLRSRSKSLDSPGIRRGQPNTVTNGLGKDTSRVRGKLDKSLISSPSPLVVPVVADAMDCIQDGVLRRSRRDEFERQQRRLRQRAQHYGEAGDRRGQPSLDHETGGGKQEDEGEAMPASIPPPVSDMDISVASQLDSSLLDAVLPPPHGFGDQTMLDEEPYNEHERSEPDNPAEGVDVDSDSQSEAGFSTISGGTVMRRTASGHYSCQDHHSVSGSSLESSFSRQKPKRPLSMPVTHLQHISTAKLHLPAAESSKSEQNLAMAYFSSRDTSVIEDQSVQEDPYVVLRADTSTGMDTVPEGEYVVLKMRKQDSATESQSAVESSKGMKMLQENYHSSEEDSSSSKATGCLNVTIGSHQDDLDNMPEQTDVTKRKSLSAEDLQCRAKLPAPSRAHSMYLSPCRKFNYKPYLEIRKETHTILARAGYMEPSAPTDKAKDIQVPVKSPTRSSYREEMKSILRSSFSERHSRLSTSLRSHKNNFSMDASLASVASTDASNTSISSDCEKLSISSKEDIRAASGDTHAILKSKASPFASELMQKVAHISAGLEASQNQHISSANHNTADINVNDNHCVNSLPNDPKSSQNSENEVKITREASGVKLGSDKAELCASGEAKPMMPQARQLKVLKKQDESLTLSSFLDKGIENQVQIKRAEMALPKHDSILDVQQAGIVAQSVRHFSQHRHKERDFFSAPPVQKKGNQALRIPTIFAKSEDMIRHYKEIGNFVRERSGADTLSKLPQTPVSSKLNGDSVDPSEDDVGSESSECEEGNVTVLEMKGTKCEDDGSVETVQNAASTLECSNSDPDTSESKMDSNSSLSPPTKLKTKPPTSQCVENEDLCSPRKSANLQESKMVKSPLFESTNTVAATAAVPKPAIDLSEALSLCETSEEVLTSLASCHKSQPRPHTPGVRNPSRSHLKRLKASGSTLRPAFASTPSATAGVASDRKNDSDLQPFKFSTAIVDSRDDMNV